MSAKRRYYIAYGSNLNVAQMKVRCPGARIVGEAMLPNYHLLYRGSKTGSYLTIEPMKGSKVPVIVWSVTPEDEARLDRYEGYPTFYYKKEMDVSVMNIMNRKRTEKNCFVYIMHEDRPIGIPTWHYVETCLDGYRDFDFDTKYIEEALKYSKENM